VLGLCDKLRDDDLPVLGVRLEDKGMHAPIWKYDDPSAIQKDIEIKRVADIKKKETKFKLEEEKKRKEAEKMVKMKINPIDMFRIDQYEDWQ